MSLIVCNLTAGYAYGSPTAIVGAFPPECLLG